MVLSTDTSALGDDFRVEWLEELEAVELLLILLSCSFVSVL